MVRVCTTHQNKILFVDALNWEVTCKNLVNKVVRDPSNHECMMHHCTNCPGTNALGKSMEEELSDIDPDFQFHYLQWQTTDKASLVTATPICEEYKDTLISAINAKKKSLKANEVLVLGYFAENYQFLVKDKIQSYHWSKEYYTHLFIFY